MGRAAMEGARLVRRLLCWRREGKRGCLFSTNCSERHDLRLFIHDGTIERAHVRDVFQPSIRTDA